MNIQIINTGREIMLGRTLNTHHQWLSDQLSRHGYTVDRQVAVDDSAPAIQAAVRDALGVADLVITTGGLGPTRDDRTRELIAALLGSALREDAEALALIRSFFAARHRECPERVKVQALVPEGAKVLYNRNGTAPGLAVEVPAGAFRAKAACLIMLPGPPRELRPMFRDQTLPLIRERFPQNTPFAFRVLRSTGLGESMVEDMLSGPLQPLTALGLETGYCARPGEVDVQLLVRGDGAAKTLDEAERIVRGIMEDAIFGVDEESLEETVVCLLRGKRLQVALAESCTGGYVAHRITNVPGASDVFLGSLVTYSNDAKRELLGVRAQTLSDHGAVSEPTAREMAQGVRERMKADLALSVTGIAGPSGGTETKPVGTVFIGLADARGVKAARFQNPFDRETFKYVTSRQALAWLRRTLLKSPVA